MGTGTVCVCIFELDETGMLSVGIGEGTSNAGVSSDVIATPFRFDRS